MSATHDSARSGAAHPERIALPSTGRAPTATTIVLFTIVLALWAFIMLFD